MSKRSYQLCCMWSCIVRVHDADLFISLPTLSNDLSEKISDLEAAVNISPFGMTWHQQLGIHADSRRRLASISGSESYASPDPGPDRHLAARSSHDLICRQVEL
jgi:hypothetical protein